MVTDLMEVLLWLGAGSMTLFLVGMGLLIHSLKVTPEYIHQTMLEVTDESRL